MKQSKKHYSPRPYYDTKLGITWPSAEAKLNVSMASKAATGMSFDKLVAVVKASEHHTIKSYLEANFPGALDKIREASNESK